jgi:hypothetical protein
MAFAMEVAHVVGPVHAVEAAIAVEPTSASAMLETTAAKAAAMSTAAGELQAASRGGGRRSNARSVNAPGKSGGAVECSKAQQS